MAYGTFQRIFALGGVEYIPNGASHQWPFHLKKVPIFFRDLRQNRLPQLVNRLPAIIFMRSGLEILVTTI